MTLLPVGQWLRGRWKRGSLRRARAPERVDGVLVLGGAVDPRISRAWGQPALDDSAERFTTLIELGRRWPSARLVFSGGVAPLIDASGPRPIVAKDFYQRMGFDVGRIAFEDRSGTTRENALFSLALLRPKPGETWLLVTSAAHMPRAMGDVPRGRLCGDALAGRLSHRPGARRPLATARRRAAGRARRVMPRMGGPRLVSPRWAGPTRCSRAPDRW